MSLPTDDQIISSFIEDHNLQRSDLLAFRKEFVVVLVKAKLLIDQSTHTAVDRLESEDEPTWALLLTMLDRVFEQVEGAVGCYLSGFWAASEALTRVAIEAATNVIYVLGSDRSTRLGAYLTSYFEAARENQRKLEKALAQFPEAETVYERNQLSKAREYLEFRENLIQALCHEEKIPFPEPGWPGTVLGRFEKINELKAYRTLYSVLSSQIHNDADSLVDLVAMKCLAKTGDAMNVASEEVHYWVRHFVTHALDWYLRACIIYADCFSLQGVMNELSTLRAEMSKLAESDHSEFIRRQQCFAAAP